MWHRWVGISEREIFWLLPPRQIDHTILQQQNKQLRANKRLSVPLLCVFWLGLAMAEATKPSPTLVSALWVTQHSAFSSLLVHYRLGQSFFWHRSKQK